VSQESNYSVTFKTPKGNLVTVRADTADGWVTNLNDAAKSGALTRISGIETLLAEGGAGQQASPATSGSQAAFQAGQQPAQELPAGMGVKCETCQAPARFEKEGVSARSGQPYKRYSCTANALHKATFTN
jgi:hypothetical protein